MPKRKRSSNGEGAHRAARDAPHRRQTGIGRWSALAATPGHSFFAKGNVYESARTVQAERAPSARRSKSGATRCSRWSGDESLPADLHADIEFLKAPDVLRAFGRPDVVWASPDCATFSMAGISRHRRKNANTGNLDPVSDYALKCDRVDLAMLRLIRDLRPAL